MFAPKLAALRNMTDEELVKRYDELTQNTAVGLDFIKQEIIRRDQNKQAEAMQRQTDVMVKYTKYIVWMTVVMTVATIINLVVAFVLLRKG